MHGKCALGHKQAFKTIPSLLALTTFEWEFFKVDPSNICLSAVAHNKSRVYYGGWSKLVCFQKIIMLQDEADWPGRKSKPIQASP